MNIGDNTSGPTMFLMIGLPRSGKSTWAESNSNNAILISNDWIRENILHAPHCKSTDPAVWMIVDASARLLLSQGTNVIIDGVHLTKSVRKFFVDMARECGAEIVMVCVQTSLHECLLRNQKSHKLPDHVLVNMHAIYEYPTQDEYDYMLKV